MSPEMQGDPYRAAESEAAFWRSLDDIMPGLDREGVKMAFEAHPNDFIEEGFASVDFIRSIDHPQSVGLDQAKATVRGLIATPDQVAADSFDVTLRIIVDDEVDDAVDALRHLRLVEAFGTAVRRSLAVTLVRDRGRYMRDAGKVIGLSHQRVAQLIEEHDALGGDKRPDLGSCVDMVDKMTNRTDAITFRAGDGRANSRGAPELLTKYQAKPAGLRAAWARAVPSRSSRSPRSTHRWVPGAPKVTDPMAQPGPPIPPRAKPQLTRVS